MKFKNLTIMELESYYNLIQHLIDDTIKRGRQSILEKPKEIQSELNVLNKYRDIIRVEIKTRLNETFN